MRLPPRPIFALLAVVFAAACAQPQTQPSRSTGSSAAPGTTASQPSGRTTMTVSVRFEAVDLAAKTLAGIGAVGMTKRLFNAGLVLKDGKGVAQPYLAESLPRLNTDSWRVLPDGKMETTYRLKPNVTWHDGTALTADDFVFASRVYASPALGMFIPEPQDKMEEVSAPDPQTVVIRWRTLYPDADALVDSFFAPLPRHVLGDEFASFEQGQMTRDNFAGQNYWNTSFIGAGPYRLERWEPGFQIEGTAFAGHVLGRPKVERVVLRILGDENTVLSNMLSDNIDVATDVSLQYEQGATLRREWSQSRRGEVIFTLGLRHYSYFQFRPDHQKTPALLDVRVRRAIAHGIDKQGIVTTLFDGLAPADDSFVAPSQPYFPDVDRAITKYAYDPRRTAELMSQAGFEKDRDGFFADSTGTRFRPDLWAEQSPLWENELALMVDTLTRAGVEVQPFVLPTARVRDNEARATAPGIYTASTGADENRMEVLTTGQIGSPANRWGGGNRGGWSNAEVDRLWEGFKTTLERPERTRQVIQIAKIISDELPVMPLNFNPGVLAYTSSVKGPEVGLPESTAAWNVHEWELRN